MSERIRLWASPPFALRPSRWADGRVYFRFFDQNAVNSSLSTLFGVLAAGFFVGVVLIGQIGASLRLRTEIVLLVGLGLVAGCVGVWVLGRRAIKQASQGREIVLDHVEGRIGLRVVGQQAIPIRWLGALRSARLGRCTLTHDERSWHGLLLISGPEPDAPRVLLAALDSAAEVQEYAAMLPPVLRELEVVDGFEWHDDRGEFATISFATGRQALDAIRYCPRCRYDLSGAGVFECPECGWGKPSAGENQAAANGASD